MTNYLYGDKLILNNRNGGSTTIQSDTDLIIDKASASMYSSVVYTPASFVQNEWDFFPVGSVTTPVNLNKFTHTSNHLVYSGNATITVLVNYSYQIIGDALDGFEFGISINDEDPEEQTIIGLTVSATAVRVPSSSCYITLTSGDFIAPAIRNISGTNGCSISRMSITVI